MSFFDDWYGILANVGEYNGDDEEEVDWDEYEGCNCSHCKYAEY